MEASTEHTLRRAQVVCEMHAKMMNKLRDDYLEGNPDATEQGFMPMLLEDRADFALEVRAELNKILDPR